MGTPQHQDHAATWHRVDGMTPDDIGKMEFEPGKVASAVNLLSTPASEYPNLLDKLQEYGWSVTAPVPHNLKARWELNDAKTKLSTD
jgi:hypothetical protein